MYSFVDTTDSQVGRDIPSEALMINGTLIEDEIPEYRTLHVSGRELLETEVTTLDSTVNDGTRYQSKRYPERTITVTFQLIAGSNARFRTAFNELNALLNVEEAQLIFMDEPDKYYIGTMESVDDIDPGKNAVTGSFSFKCSDPFKYSMEEYEVEPTDNAFVFEYGGTYRAFPKFEVDFYNDESGEENDNGRCGYVAFFDDEEHILQFGNPEELSEEQIEVVEQETNTYQVPTTKVMVNHSFKKSSAWNTLKTKYKNNSGVLYGTVTQNGTMGEKHSQNSTSEGTYYLTASSYGSGSGWHGAVTTYSLSESATDFQMQYAQKMCVDSTSAGKRQKGRFQMILSDASGKIVAGVDIYKSGDGTKGKYRMIVDGKIRKEAEIDLSLHNKRFGENRAENKKKKITAIKIAKSSCITKKGSRISFDLGGIKASFTVESVATKSVSKITIGFFQKRTAAAMKYNGMYEMKLVKNYKKTVTETIDKIVLEWHDVQNKFNANDVLSIDCASASVKLNELDRQDLGALGNSWEEFYLMPGVNQIGFSWSEWVEEAYAPTFKLKYREVFL